MERLRPCALTAAVIVLAAGVASAITPSKMCTDLSSFAVVDEVKWGDRCGTADSLSVFVRNDWGGKIRIELCLEARSGTWDCVVSDENPGERIANWTCHATGNYIIRAILPEEWGQGCFPNASGTHKPIPVVPGKVLQPPGGTNGNHRGGIQIGNANSTPNGGPNGPPGGVAKPAPPAGWVQFFHRGSGGRADRGVQGATIDLLVDGRHRVEACGLLSTSIGGPPRGQCDKATALKLPAGEHWYSFDDRGAKFSLAEGECKVVVIPMLGLPTAAR